MLITYKSIKMKKILSLFIIATAFTSCDNSVESDIIAGKWLLDDSRFEKGYMAGDQKDYDLVKKFLDAYENMDPQGMVDLSAETVKFHPADIGGVFDVDMTNTDFIAERQSNWDSISRDYIFIMPLKMEDSKNRVVTTAFTETRYIKDGTSESINYYERLYINEQDKIMRVVQYSRPPND